MSITYWRSEDRNWFCILADDGVCKSTVSLTQKEARDLAAAIDRLDVTPEAKSEAVQDTWFTDSRLPVVAMSGDVESDHVLKLHFRRPVADQDRIDLTDAMNMKILTEAKSQEPDAGQLSVREFREDAFRSMEVQICGDTRTVQFGVEDHGGDHPTMPCCALSWTDAADLASWVQSCITHPTTKPEAPASTSSPSRG